MNYGKMKIHIDTNIYSNAVKGNPIAQTLLQRAEEISLSPIVIAEIISGFKLGNKESENRKKFYQFLDSPRVIVSKIGEMTAEHYSNIIFQLRKSGKPIPTNDIWIAAKSMEEGKPLASLDKHFHFIKGLLLISEI